MEVDFVVYGPQGLWGLEVKNTRTVRPSDLRGLKAFRDEYPESRVALLYRGQERILRDGILCLPCADFLGKLYPDRALEEACQQKRVKSLTSVSMESPTREDCKEKQIGEHRTMEGGKGGI